MNHFVLACRASTLTQVAGLYLGAAQALPMTYEGRVSVGLGAVVFVAGALTNTPASY